MVIFARRSSGTASRSRSRPKRRRRHSIWGEPWRRAGTFRRRCSSTSGSSGASCAFSPTPSSRFSTSIFRWPSPRSGSVIARRRRDTSRRSSGARRTTRSATPSWPRSRVSALLRTEPRLLPGCRAAPRGALGDPVEATSVGKSVGKRQAPAPFGPAQVEPFLNGRRGLRLLLLAGLTALSLAPFLGKSFHIDDPLFVWAAKQVQVNPGNPYGFDVNWYGITLPMSEVTKTPPLTSYYIAAVAAVLGWSERTLH